MCAAVRQTLSRLMSTHPWVLATTSVHSTLITNIYGHLPETHEVQRYNLPLYSLFGQHPSWNIDLGGKRLLHTHAHHLFSRTSSITAQLTRKCTKNHHFPKLVIFDKNGTLINYHVNWSPWIIKLAERLESVTGKCVTGKILCHLDVCEFTNKVRSGILGHGTSWQIKRELEDILTETGLARREAQLAVEKCWQDCDTSNPDTLKAVEDLESIFLKLKSHQIKIAVCTSDTRKMTEKTLQNLKLLPHIDFLICGDDINSQPKPNSHNAQLICIKLGVSPSEAVIIGDTEADVRMGLEAGIGLTIGVLSGIGTRLDLAPHANCVVDNIQQAIPIILGEPRIQKTASENLQLPDVRKVENDVNTTVKARLVIFDKDGTLICFHSMWTPWAKSMLERLEEATGLSLYHRVMEELGYCHKREKWRPGVLAEGTAEQTQDRIIGVLTKEGVEQEEAEKVMESVWEEGDHHAKSDSLKTLANLAILFRTLQEQNIKVAICTADNRQPTEQFLESAGLDKYVDLLVCGDDNDSVPKPSPHNALKICATLDIPPSQAVVVGDTKADLGMGRSAGLGATVAVLSGVGEVDDLDPKADHIVSSVGKLLPIVIKRNVAQ